MSASLHAVVMAAGEGSRLRPLSERWPKPILPIDGRPVIGTLLRDLASAGIESATVVTGHLAGQVEALVGDGSAFGLAVRFARQPEALGSADAVRRALAAGARAPLLVSAADTVYRPGALARAAEQWLSSRCAAGLGVRRGGGAGRTPVDVAGSRVTDIGGARGEMSAAPVWFLGQAVITTLERVPGPPYELVSALREQLDAGIEILALEVGPTRDITRAVDVVAENFPYLWRSDE